MKRIEAASEVINANGFRPLKNRVQGVVKGEQRVYLPRITSFRSASQGLLSQM